MNQQIEGPPCPLTGRTVADELQHAVAMLQSERVADRDGVRFTDAEYRAYCDGWYRGISRALAVMVTALSRRATRLETFAEGEDRRVQDHHGATEDRFYAEHTGPAVAADAARATSNGTPGRPRGAASGERKRGARVVNLRAGRSRGRHGNG